MVKIEFIRKHGELVEFTGYIEVRVETEPFSFDCNLFSNLFSACPKIYSITFVDFEDKYQANGLGALLGSDKKTFELEIDTSRAQLWTNASTIRHRVKDSSKLQIDLAFGVGNDGFLRIGFKDGFKSDIAKLTVSPTPTPTPNLTVRKHCNECQKETLHFLEILGQELCFPCDWKTLEDYWKDSIKSLGFDKANKEWEANKNSPILQELNSEEKQQWLKVVVPKIDRMFVKKQNEEQPSNYLSYALTIGIGGVFVAILLFFVFSKRKIKKSLVLFYTYWKINYLFPNFRAKF